MRRRRSPDDTASTPARRGRPGPRPITVRARPCGVGGDRACELAPSQVATADSRGRRGSGVERRRSAGERGVPIALAADDRPPRFELAREPTRATGRASTTRTRTSSEARLRRRRAFARIDVQRQLEPELGALVGVRSTPSSPPMNGHQAARDGGRGDLASGPAGSSSTGSKIASRRGLRRRFRCRARPKQDQGRPSRQSRRAGLATTSPAA